MCNAGEIFEIDREAIRHSIVHSIDARVKLISALAIVIAAVLVGRSKIEFSDRLLYLFMLEGYIISLALLSRINMGVFFKRILILLPFGGTIAVLRPFFDTGDVVFQFYFLRITREGLEAGATLMAILIVSLSAIVLLSSVTRISDMVLGIRALGVPREFSLLLGITLRYLFVYAEVFRKLREAQANRAFSLHGRKSHVFKTLGYTVGALFIRSMKQGINLYQAMLSRGYSTERYEFSKKKLKRRDFAALIINFCAILLFSIFLL